MTIRLYWFPLTLIVVAIVLLIGCIPIPSTRQLQPRGTPRPEQLIGYGPERIELGKTSIVDAMILVDQHLEDRQLAGFFDNSGRVPVRPTGLTSWSVSTDRRQFAVQFQVRTTTMIWPLCFHAYSEQETRWMILHLDEHGTIVDSHSSDAPPPFANLTAERVLEIFDGPARQKLHEAGVLPSDERLQELNFWSHRPPRIPSTLPKAAHG